MHSLHYNSWITYSIVDHSTDGLIRREKVSKETVPEASQDGVLEMKLLPENVTQQYGNQTEIKSMERKSQRDFSVDREIENPDKNVRQFEEKDSNEFSDKIISESSGIPEELIQTFESNNKNPNEGFGRDHDVENKSQSDEQLLLGKTVPKLHPSNTLETVPFIKESQTDFIQNSQSIVKTEEKIEAPENSTLDSIPEKHSKHLFDKTSIIKLGNDESELDGESSRKSKDKKFDSNIEKVKSNKKSQSGVIGDNKSTLDAEQILEDSISSSSKTNEEGPEVSVIIYGPKSSATLNLSNVEKSGSASFSSRLDKPKSSIFIERGQPTSLDRVHPSLASLKSTKAPLSKDKKLVEIYNKTSKKTATTNEPTVGILTLF